MSDSNSWHIPKKTQTSDPQQQQQDGLARRPSMDSAIPRKSSSRPPGEDGGSLTSTIPKKSTESGGAPMAAIPRKHKSSPPSAMHSNSGGPYGSQSHSERPQQPSREKKPSYIVSEYPFKIKLDLRGVSLMNDGITPPTSRRAAKRDRLEDYPDHNVFEDTDSEEDFLMDSSDDDDHDFGTSSKKKTAVKKIKIKKSSDKGSSHSGQAKSSSSMASINKAQLIVGPSVDNIDAIPATAFLDLENTSVESPPPGTLSTLCEYHDIGTAAVGVLNCIV